MSAKCTECGRELRDTSKRSALREGKRTERFVQCDDCGNVMIGKYSIVGQKLKSVTPTPKDNSAETQEMIEEAKNLFRQVGNSIARVELNKEVPKVKEEDIKKCPICGDVDGDCDCACEECESDARECECQCPSCGRSVKDKKCNCVCTGCTQNPRFCACEEDDNEEDDNEEEDNEVEGNEGNEGNEVEEEPERSIPSAEDTSREITSERVCINCNRLLKELYELRERVEELTKAQYELEEGLIEMVKTMGRKK